MKRLFTRGLFYFIRVTALIFKAIYPKFYMPLIIKAHRFNGLNIIGKPEYIDPHCHLDPSGGLTLHEGVVLSTNVIILTHDWSCLIRGKAGNNRYRDSQVFKPVIVDINSFIGAGSILLPGTVVGKYCIIGAGAVVKGTIPDYSIVVGNPCKIIGDTRN